MRFRIAKFYGFGVPLGLMAAAIFGRNNEATALMSVSLLLNGCSLCAPESFRINSAKQISAGRITFSAILALLMMLITASGVWAYEYFTRGAHLMLILCAFMIVLARLCSERCAAGSDLTGALMVDVLSGLFLAMSLLLGSIPEEMFLYGAAALAIPCALSLFTAPAKLPPARIFSIFREIPLALLRTLLFPAVWALLTGFVTEFSWKAENIGMSLGFFGGCIAMELSRSTFRRNEMESRAFNVAIALALFGVACVKTLITVLVPGSFAVLNPMARGIMLAAGCALALYANFSWRMLAAVLLLAVNAAGMFAPWMGVISDALTIPCIVCMLPDILALHRFARAKRIRAKAISSTRR